MNRIPYSFPCFAYSTCKAEGGGGCTGCVDGEWPCVAEAVGQFPRGQLSGKKSVNGVV